MNTFPNVYFRRFFGYHIMEFCWLDVFKFLPLHTKETTFCGQRRDKKQGFTKEDPVLLWRKCQRCSFKAGLGFEVQSQSQSNKFGNLVDTKYILKTMNGQVATEGICC